MENSNNLNDILVDTDVDNVTLQFARNILSIELEIKDLKSNISEIKKEAKADGVATSKVNKALKKMKDMLKVNDMDLLEIETIENVLKEDVDIKSMVAELVRKD